VGTRFFAGAVCGRGGLPQRKKIDEYWPVSCLFVPKKAKHRVKIEVCRYQLIN
jgi:hypothetical protein